MIWDVYAQRWMQSAYDYLLDRFGMLIGTLMAIWTIGAFVALCASTDMMWLKSLAALLTALLMFFYMALNGAQRKGDHAEINTLAMYAERSWLGAATRLMWLTWVPIDIVRSDWSGMVLDVCTFCLFITHCVRVRDRDEDRFKERRFAHASS